jgi:RNA ligase-like protein
MTLNADPGYQPVEHIPFPKIGRLHKDIIVTEKIDGTNAAIQITEDGVLYAQSRTRLITPGDDNYGFATWVQENELALEALGPGVHFGEWWGKGVQRGYGLDQKRFSLFNVGRWTSIFNLEQGMNTQCIEVPVCHVVPVLLRWGSFDMTRIQEAYDYLRIYGSAAAPGFSNPEGVVVFHTARGSTFKLSDAKSEPGG